MSESAEGTEVKHFVDSWDESVCVDSWDELMVHFVRRKDVVLSLLWDNRRWLGACFLSNLWDKFRCDQTVFVKRLYACYLCFEI